MRLKRHLFAFVSLSLMTATCVEAGARQATVSTPPTCEITQPNGRGTVGVPPSPGYYGNGALQVGLPGIVVFRPGGPGQVLEDGALSMKVWWRRGIRGQLRIE